MNFITFIIFANVYKINNTYRLHKLKQYIPMPNSIVISYNRYKWYNILLYSRCAQKSYTQKKKKKKIKVHI